MYEIKIIFFVLGTFFGIENGQIAAEKATVSINPEAKTVSVLHETLFSVVQNENDSTLVYQNLKAISDKQLAWNGDLAAFINKTYTLSTAEDGSRLNVNLSMTYSDPKDLEVFGITVNQKDLFSMMHVVEMNLQTEDGILNDRYWNFPSTTPFSFTVEAYKDMPEKYAALKQVLVMQ